MDTYLLWGTAIVFLALHSVLATFAVLHVLLNRREPTATILWIQCVVFIPLLGPMLYAAMGLHRVRRKYRRKGARKAELRARYASLALMVERKRMALDRSPPHVTALCEAMGRLTGRPLLMGNNVEPLLNGEAAFPAMLAAMEGAQHHIHLLSYIFDSDETGQAFMDALAAAVQRGVQARVLYDAVGASDTPDGFFAAARRRGIQVEAARPIKLKRWRRGLHFRNHRKILIVDGKTAFTGGMNISARYFAGREANPHRCVDVHFKVTGPVVGQLQEVFIEDWDGSTSSPLLDDAFFPAISSAGDALCRVISSSPAGEYEFAHAMFFQALACAQRHVEIMTPYFIPDSAMLAALRAAVLRGVKVEVLVPGQGDSAFVQAAVMGMLPEVLMLGVNVYVRQPPFIHAKAIIVDGQWASVGSANWDARSFRFLDEVNVEVVGEKVIAALSQVVAHERSMATRWSSTMMAQRSLPTRVWERTAALFGPTL